MRKILYDLGLLLLGISIWSIAWKWLDWTLVGVIQRATILTIGIILIYKCR